ncbi:MAG: hypothetical protein F6K03_14115, partial [Kamptonema sp. SIO4C4]|nr:hypothetical protein [Kamptonema sp. SIO4C4]
DWVHNLQGISEMPDGGAILKVLAAILKQISPLPNSSPFYRLNQQILAILQAQTTN